MLYAYILIESIRGFCLDGADVIALTEGKRSRKMIEKANYYAKSITYPQFRSPTL